MKLKKIASLALAGVMAVSMLAGCGTNNTKPGEGEGENPGVIPPTGFSATLEDAVDTKRDDITFKDDTADQAALEKMVAGLSTKTVENFATGWAIPHDLDTAVEEDVAGALKTLKSDVNVFTAKLNKKKFGQCMKYYAIDDNGQINTVGIRAGVVYAFNGGVNTDYALNTIAEKVAKTIEGLPKKSIGGTTSWDYTYTVSASAVTRAQQDNYTAATNNTTFVLVTITRNVTNAKV